MCKTLIEVVGGIDQLVWEDDGCRGEQKNWTCSDESLCIYCHPSLFKLSFEHEIEKLCWFDLVSIQGQGKLAGVHGAYVLRGGGVASLFSSRAKR
jgi:hypothetical protein